MKFSWLIFFAILVMQSSFASYCGLKRVSRPLRSIIYTSSIDTQTFPGAWPWVVTLHFLKNGNFFCGATLVSNKALLSGELNDIQLDHPILKNNYLVRFLFDLAAHCFQFTGVRTRFFAGLGRFNISNENEPHFIKRNISKKIVHNDYDPNSYNKPKSDADIAILFMESEVQFSNFIQPICLPSGSENVLKENVEGIVIGYGQRTIEGPFSETPKHAKITTVDLVRCLTSDPFASQVVSLRNFCGTVSGTTLCEGDSGFGFYTRDENFRWNLVGILATQFNLDCNEELPSVFVNIIAYVDWINNHTSIDYLCTNHDCGDKVLAQCEIKNQRPTCVCENGLEWNESIKECSECLDDAHCSHENICIRNKCRNPCENKSCGSKNGATCVVKNRIAICECNSEYTWFQNVNECYQCVQNSDCGVEEICENNKCKNPCDGFDCGSRNGAKCIVENKKPICKCNKGYKWFKEINDCHQCRQNSDCSKNEICEYYYCINPCKDKYCGTKNGATCKVINKTATCTCNDGFRWFSTVRDCYQCIEDINCKPNEICSNFRCIDPCSRIYCGNPKGAKCVVEDRKPKCVCKEGFKYFPSASDCHQCVENSDCPQSEVCTNNQCKNPCEGHFCGLKNGAKCEVVNRRAVCKCTQGFKWFPDVKDCYQCFQNSDCLDNQTCLGNYCKNPCDGIPCGYKNGARCEILNREPVCKCDKGFQWFKNELDCFECTIDENCHQNEKCIGNKCIKLCQYYSCPENSKCIAENGAVHCSCLLGFRKIDNGSCVQYEPCEGYNCTVLCQNQKCPNNSRCLVENEKVRCTCFPGFRFNRFGICETYDPCEDHECPKYSQCEVKEYEPKCKCIDGLTMHDSMCKFQCENGTKFYDQNSKCDGNDHCNDRIDEIECVTGIITNNWKPPFCETCPTCPDCEDVKNTFVISDDFQTNSQLFLILSKYDERLQSFHIERNLNFKFLPLTISNTFPNIFKFTAFKCSIRIIQRYSFADLKKLQVINLRGNEIEKIEEKSFGDLISLQEVYLNENKLADLPVNIFQGPSHLKVIQLERNNLKITGHELFVNLIFLEKLYLGNNKLRILSDIIFKDLKGLELIDVHDNDLQNISGKTFCNSKDLKKIYLHDNNLKNIPVETFKDLDLLKSLSLCQNKLRTLERKVFSSLENLEALSLHENEIETLPDRIFDELLHLKVLTLDHNKFAVLGDYFKNLGNLEMLDLSYNLITSIPIDAFEGLLKLEFIDLSYNDLNFIAKEFFKMNKNLKFINIKKNNLKKIDAEIYDDLNALKLIDMTNNDCIDKLYGGEHKKKALNDFERKRLKEDLKSCVIIH